MNEPTPAPGRLDNPTDQRLRRCERLRRRTDFDRVFKSGARGGNRVVRVALVANDLKLRRVGFAVGKRFGNAVRRNLTKRRMREAFRRLKDKLPESVDLVLMPSRDWKRGARRQPTALSRHGNQCNASSSDAGRVRLRNR